MNSIRKIKKITTTMDLIGLCLASLLTVITIVLLVAFTNFASGSTNFFGDEELSDLVGGFQILGYVLALGISYVAVAFIWILLFILIAVLIAFAVPTLYGMALRKRTEEFLALGDEVYRAKAKKDSIIKLIFNGIPAACFLYSMIDAQSFYAVGIVLYYAVICGLEIKSLS